MTSSDLQKEWQMAGGCTQVQNRLLEAGLKSCKEARKKNLNDRQRRARLGP